MVLLVPQPTTEEPHATTHHERTARENTANEQPQDEATDGRAPFPIAHHNGAGVRLYKFPRFKQIQLRFENYVPPSIEDRLHKEGWTYREAEGVYTKQFGREGQAAAIVSSRRLFGEICQHLAPPADRGREGRF